MELVGAHKEALSAIDLMGAGSEADKILSIQEETCVKSLNNVVQNDESRETQNGKTDESLGPGEQLVHEEEREKGRVGFSVYWKYVTTAYGGALVPFILLAQILFQLLQIGSNYWMAWASPVSETVAPPVDSVTLIIVSVALAIGSSFCILARAVLLAIAGYKTATLLFKKMHFCIFRAPMSFFDATPSGRILKSIYRPKCS